MALPFLGIQLIYVAIAIINIQKIHESVDNVKRCGLYEYYDYIVIGLGSAGSVVAKRLADSGKTVLGLEAGGPQSAFTDIPAFAGSLIGTDYDWKFKTVPQNSMGLAYNGHRLGIPRGRVIGGTSVINNMVYNRGNRKVYDDWAQTYGAIGWKYDDVLEYFIKSENNSNPIIVSENSRYHGTQGPVGVSSPSLLDPILAENIQALNALGITTTDINGPQQLGTSILQFTIKNGLRSSTANAYLEPNRKPENLIISLESYVTKILIENSIAIGAEFIKNNKTYKVLATKEVILCAGSINSPQILMLSGIGPKDHLNQLGIPVIADLPVGNYLKDHSQVEIYATVNDPNKCITPQSLQLNIPDLYTLYVNKTGLLAQALLPLLTTYYNTIDNSDKTWPNTALFALAIKYSSGPSVTSFDPSIQKDWLNYYSQFANQCVLVFRPLLARPKTLGTVRLNTTNPFDPPLIDPNYVSEPQDLEDFVEIIRFAYIVWEKSSLASQVTTPKNPIPRCEDSFCPNKNISDCDPYLKCLIREIGKSGNHQIGTCRMGSVGDVVVDESLKVIGIEKLRVVDGSVMSNIPNANTNAAVIMIGEYGAVLIEQDNQ